MATSKKTSGGTMPPGFVSPFKRVQMEERNDDALACIATITGNSLADVTKLAVQLGYPPHGPAFVDITLINKILYNLGFESSGDYLDIASFDALPDVAILMVDYNEALDMGRHVVWHHVRGTENGLAFSYVVDVAQWLSDPAQYASADWRHIKTEPSWYIEVKPRATKRK